MGGLLITLAREGSEWASSKSLKDTNKKKDELLQWGRSALNGAAERSAQALLFACLLLAVVVGVESIMSMPVYTINRCVWVFF